MNIINLEPLNHSAVDIRRESQALHAICAMTNGDKRDASAMWAINTLAMPLSTPRGQAERAYRGLPRELHEVRS